MVDPDYDESLAEFREVQTVTTRPDGCNDEYWTMWFSKVPGDCYFFDADKDYLETIEVAID